MPRGAAPGVCSGSPARTNTTFPSATELTFAPKLKYCPSRCRVVPVASRAPAPSCRGGSRSWRTRSGVGTATPRALPHPGTRTAVPTPPSPRTPAAAREDVPHYLLVVPLEDRDCVLAVLEVAGECIVPYVDTPARRDRGGAVGKVAL